MNRSFIAQRPLAFLLLWAVSSLLFSPFAAAQEDCSAQKLRDTIEDSMQLSAVGDTGTGYQQLVGLDDCYQRFADYWFYKGLLGYTGALEDATLGKEGFRSAIDQAGEDMRYAMDLDPSAGDYWVGYALVLTEQGSNRKAVDYYRKFFATPQPALKMQKRAFLPNYLTSLFMLADFEAAMAATRRHRWSDRETPATCRESLTYLWNVYEHRVVADPPLEAEATDYFGNACLD